MNNQWRPFQKEILAMQGKKKKRRNPLVAGQEIKTRRSYPERDLVHRPLIAWHWQIPVLAKHLFHIPNGGKMTTQQGAMKRMLGLKAGVVDLYLSYPSDIYHGYYIELKAPGKKLSNEAQRSFLVLMRSVGYAADWFNDWHEAKESILDYLSGQYVNKTNL